MKLFIDYFWYQEGYSYNPLEGQTLSTYHVIMLLLSILIFIIFWVSGNRVNNKRKILISVSIIVFILESLRVISLIVVTKVTLIGALSFHLCSIGGCLMIIAGIFRKKWMFDFVCLHALIGAPSAIIIPLGISPWFKQYRF